MSVTSGASVLFGSEVWSVALAAVIGLTNGYFGNVSMILAPGKVLDTYKPRAGQLIQPNIIKASGRLVHLAKLILSKP